MRQDTGGDREIELRGVLGEGGMGRVLLAEQRTLAREVAVKVLRQGENSLRARHALLHEGLFAGRLEHPNIVPVHTLGRDEQGRPVLVMKRIEGTDWFSLLQDPRNLPPLYEGLEPLEAHLQILGQVCQAISFAHSRGVLHRDIKPENVMVGPFGEVYLVDWGIAVALGNENTDVRLPRADEEAQPAGTPHYMAPEMAAGQGAKLGPHSDVYLLGATLHELLTGAPRHEGSHLHAMLLKAYVSAPYTYPPEVSRELGELANAACHPDPAHRPPSAEAFHKRLLEIGRHRQAEALCLQAEQSLAQLARGMDVQGTAQVFGECRFGFQQALRIWPESERAQGGLRAALGAMIDRELEAGRAEAAALLLEERLAPDEGRRARLEALVLERERERERFQQLERAADEQDLARGRRTRAGISLVVGVSLALGALVSGELEVGYGTFMLWRVALLVVLTALVVLRRKWLLSNNINRRIIEALYVTMLGQFGIRVICWLQGLPLEVNVAVECLYNGTCFAFLALMIDRRLLLAPVPFVAAALLAGWRPQWAWWLLAWADLLTFSALALVMGAERRRP